MKQELKKEIIKASKAALKSMDEEISSESEATPSDYAKLRAMALFAKKAKPILEKLAKEGSRHAGELLNEWPGQ